MTLIESFIQLVAVARAADRVRIASGEYSAGTVQALAGMLCGDALRKIVQSQGIASRPTAKKKLNKNSMTVATKPAACPPFHTVPARIAMQAP